MRVPSLLVALFLLASAAPFAASNVAPPVLASAGPVTVLALIDTGVNPYHVAFRDDSPLGQQHPCTYITGFPCDVPALPLTLDAPDYATAYALDKPLWDNVARDQLYWIPGTKIVGVISKGNGGVACPNQLDAAGQHIVFDVPPTGVVHANALGACPPERRILDDHGHGTMTVSRSAGNAYSLCPACRIVEIEGLGAPSLRWAADQGWIDVVSNSWLSLIPAPVEGLGDDPDDPVTVGFTFQYATKRVVTVAASGNGAAYISGFAPTPTYVLSTAAPGVYLVGGHDNGHVTAWSGAPTTVVADAYGGWAAAHDSLTRWEPDPISCCTSTAAPYAAGGAAAIVQAARAALGDTTSHGIRDGVLASGSTDIARGPLANGEFTSDEFSRLYRHTAQARPLEGPDDGLTHWTGAAAEGGSVPLPLVLRNGPGANPFCQGCWTLPLRWSQVPSEVNAWPQIGYGSIDGNSVAQALAVLAGDAPEPVRALDDQQYEADQLLRATVSFPVLWG